MKEIILRIEQLHLFLVETFKAHYRQVETSGDNNYKNNKNHIKYQLLFSLKKLRLGLPLLSSLSID